MKAEFQPSGGQVSINGRKSPDVAAEKLVTENDLLRERVDKLLGRISLLESTLSQRQEEIEQTRLELEEQRSASAAQDSAIKAMQAKLDEANAWVFRLAGERRSAELALSKADTERTRTQRETAALVSAHKTAVAAAQRLTVCLEQEVRDKVGILKEMDEFRTSHEALGDAHSSLRIEHAGLQHEVRRLQADHGAAMAAIGERETVIEGLRAEVQEHRQKMRGQRDLIDWLQLVAREIQHSRRWWFLLSDGKRGELLSERLSQIGLFDGQSYLERYPDVAAEGFNPLVHYLVHGMGENRQR